MDPIDPIKDDNKTSPGGNDEHLDPKPNVPSKNHTKVPDAPIDEIPYDPFSTFLDSFLGNAYSKSGRLIEMKSLTPNKFFRWEFSMDLFAGLIGG